MKPKKLNQNEIIYRLKSYIKYLKGIPGVNELIHSYENQNQKIFSLKSKIIPNENDFKFIYDEICKRRIFNDACIRISIKAIIL